MLSAAIAAALSSSATAQQLGTSNVSLLLKNGDVLGTGETVTGILSPSIAPSGKWSTLCVLDGTARRGLVIDGNLALAVGDTTPDGATVQQLYSTRISPDGVVALLYSVENPANPSDPLDRLRIGPTDVLLEGDAFNYSPLGISGDIDGFYGFDYDAPHVAVGMFVRPAGGGIFRAFVSGILSGTTFIPNGGIVGGTVLPDSQSGIPYYSPTSDCQVRPMGGACHTFNLFDNGTFLYGLRSLGNLIAEHGQPGPSPNSVWNFDDRPRIRTNGSGKNLYSGRITLSNGQDRGSVYVDGVPVAIEGGGLPGVLGGTVGQFQTASIALDENGTPFFSVPLTTSGSEVLMAGLEIVLRAGSAAFATRVNGLQVTSLFTSLQDQTFDITPDGRTVIAKVQLETGATAIVLAERDLADPTTCTTEPNSTGLPGAIAAEGSRFLSLNDLRVVATQLPPSSFGYLGISRSSTFLAMPGGSSGNLCIGPTVGRYVNQVQSSGASGKITTNVNLLAIPQPNGFVASLPGDTWYCQLWHRDSVMGSATSNFTDSLSVTIQ
ncbi:hypothetical protein Poly30_47180 [Planctomycetes bacterium Poly30]|uniref:Uncharacterized protein n=2 Tax=Saltatorellus ferox TaxID=2528018 RepID=A0A518EYJ1_9BACT|nr:hypothetical protein Poly30_47180 [Planctomycetes bacterium Poly30]